MSLPPVVILCGGLGTRLSEETVVKPKPMVEIGGEPILCHIMNIYSSYGFNEFVLALGYKAEIVKQYFLNLPYLQSDLTVDFKHHEIKNAHAQKCEWMVHLVDTGMQTSTGGRLHRLARRMDSTFMMTYGDGVSDINLRELLAFHKSHGKIATVTAVHPKARFGTMEFDGNQVVSFQEKVQTGASLINGGFFVFEPGIFEYLHGDDTNLEGEVLGRLTEDQQLMAYKHTGFWECMDTLRDKQHLEELWNRNAAPWKLWNE